MPAPRWPFPIAAFSAKPARERELSPRQLIVVGQMIQMLVGGIAQVLNQRIAGGVIEQLARGRKPQQFIR
jgi:hypothetical protein